MKRSPFSKSTVRWLCKFGQIQFWNKLKRNDLKKDREIDLVYEGFFKEASSFKAMVLAAKANLISDVRAPLTWTSISLVS